MVQGRNSEVLREDGERVAEHQILAIAWDSALGRRQVIRAKETLPLLDGSRVHLGGGRDEPACVELHLDLKLAEVMHLGSDALESVVAGPQHLPHSLLLLEQSVGFAREVVPGDEWRQLGL